MNFDHFKTLVYFSGHHMLLFLDKTHQYQFSYEYVVDDCPCINQFINIIVEVIDHCDTPRGCMPTNTNLVECDHSISIAKSWKAPKSHGILNVTIDVKLKLSLYLS